MFLCSHQFHSFLMLKDRSLATTVLVGMVELAETKPGVALCVTVPLGMKASFVQVRTLSVVILIISNDQFIKLERQPF